MKSLLVAFVFIAFVSEAQIKRYSFKVAANYPIIPAVSNPSEFTPHGFSIHQGTPPSGEVYITNASIKESFDEKAGFDAGGNVDVAINSKFFLTVGLQGSYLRFKRNTSVVVDGAVRSTNISMGDQYVQLWIPVPDDPASGSETPDDVTQSDNVGKTTTLHLQVPILAGYSMLKEKLLIRAGATISYLLNATEYKSEFSLNPSPPYGFNVNAVKVNTREGYTNVLASVTIQATYLLTKRIGIDFSANKFITPIYSNTDQNNKAKYNVFSLGLSYTISK